ncbi:MAG: NAD-dependent epimerase/dehydratase family protein [Nitrospiraceae bacterium]|nr:NAD-dependent epimerase/dehydratase family protein [Nitrospiraceae bacterium]
MRALVTGATGFIGFHVALELIRKGFEVRALARAAGGIAPELLKLGCEVRQGDIKDFDSVLRAAAGADHVYHIAADYRLWVPDPSRMYETNVAGTVNVMRAAREAGAARVVYTSTVGALAAQKRGKKQKRKIVPSDEDTPVGLNDMIGHYKRSKFLAEREVERFAREGLPVVIVNPSTPIGAMDRKPTPTGAMIVSFLKGKVPAYLDTGLNFVSVHDVALGHLLAAGRGRPGRKYILGGVNMTLRDFYLMVSGVSGVRPPRIRLPYGPVLLAACLDEAFSRLTGRAPAIPLTGVRMAGKYMYFDCSRARSELGMTQTPIAAAIHEAVEWFRANGYVDAGKITAAAA